MSPVAILYPVFVQVALTFVLLFWMAWARSQDLRSRQVRPGAIALGEPGWPARTTQVSNSFRNQFELPVLFYLVAVLAVMTRLTDIVLVALAWAFVVLRCLHAFIHTTHNDVRSRGSVYGVGALVLLALWVWFLVRFLAAVV